jgi:predicted kinase
MVRGQARDACDPRNHGNMEMIILIGLQASGKSTFARARFANHAYISKDAMRNVRNKARRQEKLIRQAFEQGQSVVVDNTNPSVADRAPLIALGREYGARVIGYYFASHLKECLERNRQREGTACVPDVALYTTGRKLELPTYTEGFDQLYYVELNPEQQGFIISEWQEDQHADESI